MLRLLVAVLALGGAGAALFFYFDFEYGLLLPAAVVVSRRVGMRFVSKILLLPILYMLMPEAWRHRIETSLRELRQRTAAALAACIRTWAWAPWWLRACMAIGGALCAGAFVALCLVFPLPVKKIPFVGEALRRRVLPYLLQQSALKGLEDRIPDVAKRIPQHWRAWLRRRYMRLWWKTARPLVRTRQALGRNMLRRKLERENARADEMLSKQSIREQRILP